MIECFLLFEPVRVHWPAHAHILSLWISLYIYKFLILHPHTGDNKSGSNVTSEMCASNDTM